MFFLKLPESEGFDTIFVRAWQQNKIIYNSKLEAADNNKHQNDDELEAQDDGEWGIVSQPIVMMSLYGLI